MKIDITTVLLTSRAPSRHRYIWFGNGFPRRILLALIMFWISCSGTFGELVELRSKTTLSVVEVNSGDVIEYELRDGRKVRMELIESKSEIVFTTLEQLKKGSEEDRTIYMMSCRLRVDGQEMAMVRYNPAQEAFYEPYTVNGLNIWFDGVRSLSDLFNENHGKCLPEKEARFAMQDADLAISPEEMGNWFPIPAKELDAYHCYDGSDTWMGPYAGADLHGGLDLDTPSNTTLFAPIDFDDQYYLSSVEKGANNNRWRGVRNCENGDVWHLQTAHLVEPLVAEHIPLKKGQAFAHAGGVHAGFTSHVHYIFRVKQPESDWLVIDPWILFWQIFRNNQEKAGSIKAVIAPVGPATTGERVPFSSLGSHKGLWGEHPEYLWDFGDGFTSTEANPSHVFSKPGIYPVSLEVTDRAERSSYVQHITINGPDRKSDSIWLASEVEHQFEADVNWKTRAYGRHPASDNQIVFYGFKRQKTHPFTPQRIRVVFGDGLLGQFESLRVDTDYLHGDGWLNLETERGDDGVEITVQPRIEEMITHHGFYEAAIRIRHNQAINSPIEIRVLVDMGYARPASDLIVKNSGPDCQKSEFFWLTPEFQMPWVGGPWIESYSDGYLINSHRSDGEFIRFRPTLKEGRYRVALYGPPYASGILMDKVGSFDVKVRHAGGMDRVRVRPSRSLEIGEFDFSLGREGFVEVISDDCEGLIVVDAVRFSLVENTGT